MKLSDKINKRKNFYLFMVAAGFAAMTVLAFTETYIPAETYKWLLYGALALFAAGNILLYIGLKCPKCDAIIGYAIVFSAEKVVQCPRCRVLFDEDIPGGSIEA